MRECVWVKAGKKMQRRAGLLGRGRVPLDLFDYQEDTVAALQREQFLLILKARQLGLTTIVMAYALWLLLFKPGAEIVLVSKDQPTADSALDMLDMMWRFLPDAVKERAPRRTGFAARQHTWLFDDGMESTIMSYAATETVAAGKSTTLTIWDEAALARFQAATLKTLIPHTDAGGSFVIFSTARGGTNTFARLWRAARKGLADHPFKTLFFPWYFSRLMNPLADRVRSCPDGPCPRCVDMREYDSKRLAMDVEAHEFYSEYPFDDEEALRMSGRSRFDGLPPLEEFDDFELRGGLIVGPDGAPEFVRDANGPLRLRPEVLDGVPDGGRAVISVDPSGGEGGDFAAMTAGWLDPDGLPRRMAFWHANQFEAHELAEQANLLGQLLADDRGRPALLVVEKQGGYGDSTIHELRRTHRYPNLYFHTYTGNRANRGETTYGFPMTTPRRPLVIDTLAKWLRFDGSRPVLDGIDPLLREELGSFVVTDTGKVEADAGAYDDLVMSCAIWLYVLLEHGRVPSPAMTDPKGEGVEQFVGSVAYIFEEAEKLRQRADRRDRRELQRIARRRR